MKVSSVIITGLLFIANLPSTFCQEPQLLNIHLNKLSVQSFSFSGDSKYIAMACFYAERNPQDGSEKYVRNIKLFEVATGQVLVTIPEPSPGPFSFSRDNKQLAIFHSRPNGNNYISI
jgi:hypothetical protein